MLSRFMMIALVARTGLLNTSSSSRNESVRAIAITQGCTSSVSFV